MMSETSPASELCDVSSADSYTVTTLRAFLFRDATLGGGLVDVPQEWKPALIEVDVPADEWELARLWRNDEPIALTLQRIEGKVRVVANWPLSGPGNYRLKLAIKDRVAEQTVTVLPRKITPAALGDLLDHLQSRLPVSIALGLQRCGALAGVEIIPPAGEHTHNEELLRLRRSVQGHTEFLPEGSDGNPQHELGLAVLLPLIARDPHYVLKLTEHFVRREHARRPHPTRLAHALTRGTNMMSGNEVSNSVGNWVPERVFDTKVEQSVDVYENRLIQAYAVEVNLRLRRLRDAPHVNALIRSECETLIVAVAQARRLAPFLDEVSIPQFLPTQPTMVILKRPAYQAVLQGYLRLHRSIAIRLDEPALDAPLENLPFLYETWGVLEVIDAVLAIAGDLGYKVRTSEIIQRDGAGFFIRVLPGGHTVVKIEHEATGTVVRVSPQRNFSRRTSPLRSISFDQRPDVTVEIVKCGAAPRLYLFDPKYKLDSETVTGYDAAENGQRGGDSAESDSDSKESRFVTGHPKKVDIDKMHAYRDAIRGKDGDRVVVYAAILYPGPEEQFGERISALPARPDQVEPFTTCLHRVLRQALDAT